MLCPVGNANCMCQYCEDKCNDGLYCYVCEVENKAVHDVYLCTGFKGNLDKYITNSIANRKKKLKIGGDI